MPQILPELFSAIKSFEHCSSDRDFFPVSTPPFWLCSLNLNAHPTRGRRCFGDEMRIVPHPAVSDSIKWRDMAAAAAVGIASVESSRMPLSRRN